MVAALVASSQTTAGAVLARSVVIGTGIGAAAGGVAGTISFPVVGTFFGALAGAAVGATIGCLNGLVLIAVVRATTSRPAVRAASALTSIGGCLALLGAGLLPGWTVHRAAGVMFVGTVAVLAGALAPIAARGARPLDLGRAGEIPVSAYLAKALTYGAVAGATIGAVAGLVLGLDYLPTAAVAVVEGAILGSVSGAVAAMIIAAALIAARLRSRS